MSEPKAAPGRIGLLDSLRGLSVLVMLLYHLLFDLVVFFKAPVWLFDNLFLDVIHYIFAGTFIALAGVSSRFSRNNLKRGLKLALAAGAVSLATWLVGIPILFGILHFLAAATFLYALGHKALDRLPERLAPFLYLLLAAGTMLLAQRLNPVAVGWLWPLGFYPADFFSGDYFPLLPWLFLFLLGTWLGKFIRDGRMPEKFYLVNCRPLAFLGRHALLVYLLHQPLLYGLSWLFVKIV